MKLQRTLKLLILAVLAVIVVGCGNRPIGHGVLLWVPEESALSNGQLVQIMEESQLNSTYTVTTPDLEGTEILPMWRVAFFTEQEEALQYANRYTPYADTFARSLRQALPIRAEQDRLSPDVYRLRDNELMKVLERADEPSNEAGFEGYWYKVLTQEGIEGWTFGYFLEITGPDEEPAGPNSAEQQEAGDIERLLSNVWRPAYFQEMINTGRIDLSRFRTTYGLFPNEEESSIRIVLPDHTVTFPYEEIFRAAPARYGLEGSPVTISIREENRISVQYTLNGREQSRVFVLLDREIPEIVEEEAARRRDLWEQFRESGNTLVSTAYGRIELLDGQRFTWTGYDRLTPTVIPSRAEESGTISFPLFLSDDLREEYDGAVLFTFESEAADAQVRFIYEYTQNGLRLTYVPAQDVQESVVQREAFSPIVIFLSYENR